MKKNERSRNWCLILYPEEDFSHQFALNYIIKNYSDYAYIKHEFDIQDNGDLKKSHYHVVIHFNNARHQITISNELHITSNYLQPCRDLNRALEYLIHYNDVNKYQYSIEEVIGTLKNKLIILIECKNMSEPEKVKLIIDFIKNYDDYLSFTSLVEFIISNNFYSTFRRGVSMFSKILDEHNFKIKNPLYNNNNNK